MTIETCYEMIGGSFSEAKTRLVSDKMIERFVGMFLNDPSYDGLKEAMENVNREEAFRYAHTLKGVSGNLSFTKLFEVSNELTEILRNETAVIGEEAYALFQKVEEAYTHTVSSIQIYLESQAE